MGKRQRIRAHQNPLNLDLNDSGPPPTQPSEVDWHEHYPAHFPPHGTPLTADQKRVTIADIGCGFGGLLDGLSPLFPDKLLLGCEIRGNVVECVHKRIKKLRTAYDEFTASSSSTTTTTTTAPHHFNNIACMEVNIMKNAPNIFGKGQLEKVFILFADPHFKNKNFRRRVINQNFLDIYAYIMKEGALLYTITDVKDLFDWTVQHCDKHPLFEKIEMETLQDDPCVRGMTEFTQEGQKVTRLHGNKYPAVYRRIVNPAHEAPAQ